MKIFVFILVFGLATASIEKSTISSEKYLRNFLDLLRKITVPQGVDEQFFTDEMIKLKNTDVGKKLKDSLNNILEELTFNESERKATQQEFFDKILSQILPNMKSDRKNGLLKVIDQFLENNKQTDINDDNENGRRVIKFFKDLNLNLQETQLKFGAEMEKALKGMEYSKDKFKNLKILAEEFTKLADSIKQEISNEAKEFFENYKEEMKSTWNILLESF